MSSLRENSTIAPLWEKGRTCYKTTCKLRYQLHHNSRFPKQKTTSLHMFQTNRRTRSNLGRCLPLSRDVWHNRKIPGRLSLHIYGLRLDWLREDIYYVWISWKFKNKKSVGLECTWGMGTFSQNNFNCYAENLADG